MSWQKELDELNFIKEQAKKMGGSSDPMGRAKDHFIEPRALDRRVPMIRLLDGAGGSVREVAHGAAQPPRDPRARAAFSDSELMAHVPLISAVLGSCAGWIAIAAATSTWSIMTKNSSELFVAGPPLPSLFLNKMGRLRTPELKRPCSQCNSR